MTSSLSDFIQRTFWQGFASGSLQITDIVVCMITVLLISIYIFFVYRWITRDTFYSKNFSLSLIALSVIVAAIILTIQTNIVISLGMVGALSIVRYRTAIKDPMDLVFLFWSITVGIICGAGFALIAVIASLILSVILVIFSKVSEPRGAMILLVNSDNYRDEEKILAVVAHYCKVYNVRSRNLTKDHLDMAIEVTVDNQGELVRRLVDITSVQSASLVAHDGEVTL